MPTSENRLVHTGAGGEYFVIFLVNLLLTVVTLGVYSFWAKARKRRYLWSHTQYDNQQFEYDGTGLEMFVGFLKGIGIMVGASLVAGLVVYGLFMLSAALGITMLVLLFLFMVFVAPRAAIYGTRKYVLSRTRYRSVRFALSGSALRYGFVGFGHGLLTLLTLGLYHPFASMKLESMVTNNMYFGSEQFEFNGTGNELFKTFLVAWLLTLPTLGLSWIWWSVRRYHYVVQQTQVGALRFESSFSTWQYVKLVLSNMFLIVFSLGLALPWVAVRSIRFMAQHVTVNGELDYTTIQQSPTKASATNEGLAEALEASFGV